VPPVWNGVWNGPRPGAPAPMVSRACPLNMAEGPSAAPCSRRKKRPPARGRGRCQSKSNRTPRIADRPRRGKAHPARNRPYCIILRARPHFHGLTPHVVHGPLGPARPCGTLPERKPPHGPTQKTGGQVKKNQTGSMSWQKT